MPVPVSLTLIRRCRPGGARRVALQLRGGGGRHTRERDASASGSIAGVEHRLSGICLSWVPSARTGPSPGGQSAWIEFQGRVGQQVVASSTSGASAVQAFDPSPRAKAGSCRTRLAPCWALRSMLWGPTAAARPGSRAQQGVPIRIGASTLFMSWAMPGEHADVSGARRAAAGLHLPPLGDVDADAHPRARPASSRMRVM